MYRLLSFFYCLLILAGCKTVTEKNGSEIPSNSNHFDLKYMEAIDSLSNDSTRLCLDLVIELSAEEIARQKFNEENIAWVDKHVNKDYLLGNVRRQDNPLYVKVDKEHTERNIYLIHPVYEAYKKMYDAALADSVHLKLTSGHRTYQEQVYEWELRWNNPRTETIFENEIEKARYILQYRAMPGTTRHHWGTDIDLNSFELAYFESQEGQAVYNWLKENAENYGFYQPYTPYNEKRPYGYREEKWHWSYKPLARHMLNKYLEVITIHDITGFEGDRTAVLIPVISIWVCSVNPKLYDSD